MLGGGAHTSRHPAASKCVSLAEGYTPASIQGPLSVCPLWRDAPQQASTEVCIPGGGVHSNRHPGASQYVSLVEGYTSAGIHGPLSVYHWRKDAPRQASKGLSLRILGGGRHPNKHLRASKCVCLVAEYTPAGIQRRLSVYPWRRDTPQQASKGL
jgi:hypothetical protein